MTCKNCSTHLGTWTPIEYKGKTHYRHECGRVFGLHTTCHKRGKMDVSPSRKSTKREASSSPRLLHVKYQHRGGLIPSLCKRLYHLPFIMKFYAVLFVILPAFAFAQPVNAPYQAYVDETIALLQADAPVESPAGIPVEAPELSYTAPEHVECDSVDPLKAKVECYASKYGVKSSDLMGIIQCESSFNPNAKNVNSRESSWGLVQINTWAHDVSVKEATDPDFAIDFLAKHWKDGKRHMWWNCSKKLGML